MAELSEYKEFIKELAKVSGDVIIPYFRDPSLVIDNKSNDTPVTIADREAERVMRELIKIRYPDHGIIGEEFGNENEDAEFVWILDPIDGTITFTTGVPLFGTLIGLLQNGNPILGVINQPILGQLCLGDGETTTLNGEPVRVRETSSLSDATMCLTDYAAMPKHRPQADFKGLASKVKIERTWGDCYGYLLLATGYIDIMLDPIMNAWDLLPVVPVVKGAGGILTGWNGEDPAEAESCIATIPGINKEVRGFLSHK